MICRNRCEWLAMACAILLACSNNAVPEAPANAANAGDTSGSTCQPIQKTPGGTCCPLGHFFSGDTHACERVGPLECAEVAFTAPETCVPRWCWDWRDAAGKACAPWSDGCQTQGRGCTDDEITAGEGCPAGKFPESDKPGECAPAGYFPGSGVPRDWDGMLQTLPPVPPLADSIPPGVPPLTTLPDVNDTFFCIDDLTGEERFCTAEEMLACRRGPNGEMPDAKQCVYVGVPWPSVCPPGFVVDEQAIVADWQLPPCLPDPTDCGQEEWPDVAGAASVVYVSADSGSDSAGGGKTTPLKTIGKALKLAAIGATVAVAAGVYNESLAASKPVTIRGRCAAMVRVDGKAGAPALAVNGKKQDGAVVVTGLRLGGKGMGLEVAGGPKVQIERVMVAGVSLVGIGVHGTGAVLDGQAIVVVGTLSRQSDLDFGIGLAVEGGGHVTLQDARLSANRCAGVRASDKGTTVAMTRLLVDGTLPRESDKTVGLGVEVEAGAHVTLQDARLSANRKIAIGVQGAAAVVDAVRLLVDGTLPQQSDKKAGHGAEVLFGAKLTLKDARFSANRDLAVVAHGAASVIDAAGLLIDGTLPQASDNKGGVGMEVVHGAHVTLQDARLSANRTTGVHVNDAGSTLTASRLLVDGTLAQSSDKQAGRGMGVEEGGEATVQDVRLSGNRDIGVYVADAGSALRATRILVDGTLANQLNKKSGQGMEILLGAQVMLQDARFSANRDIGLVVASVGTTLVATRLVVDDTRTREGDKQFGWGVGAADGAQCTLQHVRLSANREGALAVNGAGAVVDASRILIDGTLASESDKQFGRGAGAQNGATLRMHAARLVGNRDAGLFALVATLHAVGATIDATYPSDFHQEGGAGMWLAGNSTASLVASALRHNHGVGLAVDKSTLQARGLVVLATAWGTNIGLDLDGNYNGETTSLADGILLNSSPNSTVEDCLLVGNERAGILIESSPAMKVTRTLVNAGKSLYGLVFQHTLDALDQFNAVFDATTQNRASDAGLSLPVPPAAAPSPPTP